MKRAFSRKNLWDKTPPFAKRVIGAAVSKVPLPWLLGADFRRWYKLACEADRWDAERIREYQLAQLRRVITLAYEKTEFYRESFRSVGFEPGDLKQPEDIQGLPTIDKNTIREHWRRMMTCPVNSPHVDLVTTGGTSGEPLRFYMGSSRHAFEFAHLCMCWKRVGYQPGDLIAVLRGRVIRTPNHGMYHEYDPLLRHHYYSTFHMGPQDLARYLEHIAKIRPKYFHAYPTALFALAKYAIHKNLFFPDSIRSALLESEPIFPHQCDYLHEKLALKVFSCYGLSEKVILAAQCEYRNVYHVVPTYGYCEVLNADGAASAENTTGELTGTAFINDVMPFIRYRTGDDARFRGRKCSGCQREHLLLDNIQPRRGQEYLVCRDGRTLVSMATLTGGLLHDDTLDGITRFQFQQDHPGKVVLMLALGSNSAKFAQEQIHNHFNKQLGHGLELEIRFVNEIPLTRVGKQPMILQRCKGVNALHPEAAEGTRGI